MPEFTLSNCRILLAEDEYMLADELRSAFDEADAIVLGPVATVDAALELIRSEPNLHGAVLDVNLGGTSVFPAADLLIERGVPFVFTTGYDQSALPSRFEQVVRCEKPTSMNQIIRALGRAIHG